MKSPKKPTQNNPVSKPLSKKESDEDEEDTVQDSEILDEEEESDFDVPLDDLDTFDNFDDDDDEENDRY